MYLNHGVTQKGGSTLAPGWWNQPTFFQPRWHKKGNKSLFAPVEKFQCLAPPLNICLRASSRLSRMPMQTLWFSNMDLHWNLQWAAGPSLLTGLSSSLVNVWPFCILTLLILQTITESYIVIRFYLFYLILMYSFDEHWLIQIRRQY